VSLEGVQLTLVESPGELADFLEWLGHDRRILGVDIETTGLNVAKDRIRMVQFGDAQRGFALSYRDWRGIIRDIFARYRRPMVGHHWKFDSGFLARDGITTPWERTHDTMPMCFLYDSLGPKSLKAASALHIDPAAREGEAQLKKAMAKNGWTWATVPEDFPTYWEYAALDTVLTAQLAEKLWPLIQPYREAYDLEMAVERILCDMELRGARIDVGYCQDMLQNLLWEHGALLDQLAPLNPHSAAEVIAEFAKQGVTLTKRTQSGQLAVDDAVLQHVGTPFAAQVVKARELKKLMSAYFENFLEQRDGDILHPHINQLQARTGRMSVTEPALQTVPKTSFVRDAFIPREGNKLVLCDYDNEEVRLMAHFSRDPGMIAAFLENPPRDVHLDVSIRCYGEQEGPAKRDRGKRALFSKAYGAGVAKFAHTIGVPESEAQRIYNALEATYPGLQTGMEKATRIVRERASYDHAETGYVVLSDKRHIRVKKEKAYVGWNALIQGNAAAVLKRAIVDLEAAGLGEFLILPVHDELMFDVPESDVAEVVPLIEQTMRRDDWRVPLTASAKVADRWGDPYRENHSE